VENDRKKPEISATSITLAAAIMAAGRRRASELFPDKRGGNFSAYVEWLILQDLASESAKPVTVAVEKLYRTALAQQKGEPPSQSSLARARNKDAARPKGPKSKGENPD
jgi:hypothetical protein